MRMKNATKTLVVPSNCTVVCARWDILDQPEFLKTVGFVGISDKNLFGPTGGYSTFHCLV